MKKEGDKALIAALLFAIAYTITPMFKDTYPGVVELLRFPMGFVGFLLLRYFIDLALNKISKIKSLSKAEDKLSDKKVFILSLIVFFCVGFLYQMVYYPGTMSFDTAEILMFGMDVANQHPLIYCLFVDWIKSLVTALGFDETIVVFVLCFLQVIAMALVMAHMVMYLKKLSIPKGFLIVIGAAYLLSPVVFIYMVSPMKDVLYALVAAEWVIFIHECIRDSEKVFENKLTYLRVLFLIIFSLNRSNGIYVSFATILIMAIFFKKYYKKMLVYLVMVLSVFAISKGIENEMGLHHLFKETIGVPLQMVAAVVCDPDGKMTSYENAFIDMVIPLEFVKEKYNPYTADDLKWGESPLDEEYLEKNKAEFLKVWAGILVKNPGICLRAYLYETYGYWAFRNIDKYDPKSRAEVYNMSYLDSVYSMMSGDRFGDRGLIPRKFAYWFTDIVDGGLLHAHIAGNLFWVLVLILSIMIKKSGIKLVFPAIPILMGWLSVMAAAPHAFMYRYTFYIVLCLPFMAGLLVTNYYDRE